MTHSSDIIRYFYDILTSDRRAEELQAFQGTVVGTYCNFVPEELIYALDALPVRLCAGDHEAISAGEEIFPRDTCSLVKSCAGMAVRGQGFFPRIDLLVVPTPCDAKKKFGSLLERFKPVHILQTPPGKSAPASLDFWMSQTGDLIARLETTTGRKLTRSGMENAIARISRRQKAFRRFLELRKRIPSVISGEEALIVTGASFHDDIERWTANVERLCSEREERCQEQLSHDKPPGIRLLLTGAPLIYPNFKLVHLIEAAGATVAIDETCSGTQRLYHPTVVRDRSLKAMVRAAAERCLLPPTCPCFIEHTDRLNRVSELAREFQADGVIYHSLRICPLFDIEAMLMQKHSKEQGIPCLNLSTDYSREDTQQIRNRVEAFLEMLSGSIRAGKNRLPV